MASRIMEVDIKKFGKIVGHVSCSCIHDWVHIKSLYVIPKYRRKGLEDILIGKVYEYAKEKQSKKIIAYCGPEPFCEEGQMPLEEEISWYESHGFQERHSVRGVIPCMIKYLGD